MPVHVHDDVASDSAVTPSDARAPRPLGDCMADLAEVLRASHPAASALWTDLGEGQQRVRLQHVRPPRSR
jgi:hypothetical protein